MSQEANLLNKRAHAAAVLEMAAIRLHTAVANYRSHTLDPDAVRLPYWQRVKDAHTSYALALQGVSEE